MVLPTHNFSKAVHVLLHDGRAGLVVGIHRFPGLEEVVRILGRSPDEGMVRRKGAIAMGNHVFIVNHGPQVFFRQLFNFLNFMRSTETVKEVQKWYPRF